MTRLELQRMYFKQGSKATIDRGIEFNLTFDEWLKIWTDSGKLSERGCRRGQYVMSRIADKGDYSIGNVRIITTTENIKEKWKLQRDVIRQKLSQAMKGKLKGRKLSHETIERMKLRANEPHRIENARQQGLKRKGKGWTENQRLNRLKSEENIKIERKLKILSTFKLTQDQLTDIELAYFEAKKNKIRVPKGWVDSTALKYNITVSALELYIKNMLARNRRALV